MVRWFFLVLMAVLAAPAAWAQSCAIPARLPEARAEVAPAGAVRNAPVTGNILAMSWSPQFCRTHSGARYASQCGAQKFGFIVHGLWPDGAGRNNPQWCKAVPAVPRDVVRANFCAMPSVDLQAHEWAKHGSCIAKNASDYLGAGRRLFGALKFPDMDALSRERPTVGGFVTAMTTLNPGVRADMFRVTTGRGGWLEEVRLCLDTNYHATRCPRDVGGAPLRSALKIWRNVR